MSDQPAGHEKVASPQPITFETILPASMAVLAEQNGVKRAATDPLSLFVLSVLAGAFISFGAVFATTIGAGQIVIVAADGSSGLSASLPFGLTRLLMGVVFSLGILLVVLGGAELFTGNNMIVMAWASRKVTTRSLLLNWVIAFSGNAVGAFATAILMFFTTQYTFGGGSVGHTALSIASSKASLSFIPALALGIMCNALVCLAVWMCYGARTTVDRVVALIPPIAAFVAAGFEHSIANIYFIPMGLLIKAGAPESFWSSIGKTPLDFPSLTWENFLVSNLLPVTIGNIVGGSVFVAAVYWFVYLRGRPGKGKPMTVAASYSAMELLRDGRTVEIRALKLTDRTGLMQAIKRESTESLYRRFFTIKRDFTEKEADFFLNIDFTNHVALVAVVAENELPTIIGGGRYVSARPEEAEVAFSIIDDYQGLGLGTLLMRHLTAIALASGFNTLIAEVLPENKRMLKVFEKCGHRISMARRDGIVHVRIHLKA